MSEQTNKLVPKLRFPEFQDAGEWEELKLGSLGKISMCKRILKEETQPFGDVPFYKIGTFGKQADAFISREVYKNYKGKYSYPKKGDILISASGTIGRLVIFDGADAYFQDSNIVWIDNDESLVKNDFLFHCYSGIKWTTDNNTIARLYNDNLSGMKIFIASLHEQQKIANCLSSIDELITTQTQKIAALKDHKKGLMQHLFPRDGETVPKLRFPEFQDAGDWEEKTLGDLSQIVRGGSPRPIDEYITSDVNGLNWLKIADVDKDSKYVTFTKERVLATDLSKTREVNPGDLIMSNSMSFGRPYILKIKSCIHDGWIAVTKINEEVSRDYLYYLILSPISQKYFVNNAAGSGVQNLNADIIKLLPVLIPKYSEQQKIADCLSSTDELITTQIQQLESYITHKKGLMQQLFPPVGGVAGEA